MKKVKFVRRYILGNVPNNPYFNEKTFVGFDGYYKNNPYYQCANWYAGRTCEIAERKCFWYKFKEHDERLENESPSDCEIPAFLVRSGYPTSCEIYKLTNWPKTTKQSEARLGDAVCYGTDWGKGYGHVRIIEAMDDKFFYCSGGNEDCKGTVKFDIKIKREDGGGECATGLMGFVHNPFLEF